MATSVVTFKGKPNTVTETDLTTQRISFQFTPPSNIAGKVCYVECASGIWDYGGTVSGINTRDLFIISVSWAQPLNASIDNSDNRQLPGTAIAAGATNLPMSGIGPVLCSIPNGPHEVTFTVRRVDGGDVTSNVSTTFFYIALKIVPADSRQPQIGV